MCCAVACGSPVAILVVILDHSFLNPDICRVISCHLKASVRIEGSMNQAWRYTPIAPAAQEAEAGGSLELISWRLGNIARPCL
jgi:hypothetical protein